MFGIRFLPLSPALIFLSAALGIEVFSTQPGARLHLSSCSGFFLHSASLDSPWITWEKELLLSIIAPATPTTGFICWRRMTSDTSASQAGLPLSPAQALFLVAEGAERVFNEIQTLGVSSHRLLKTSLLLTSVTNVRDQKKTLSQAVWRNVALQRECTMIMGNKGGGGVQVRAKAFWRTQSLFLRPNHFLYPITTKKTHTIWWKSYIQKGQNEPSCVTDVNNSGFHLAPRGTHRTSWGRGHRVYQSVRRICEAIHLLARGAAP